VVIGNLSAVLPEHTSADPIAVVHVAVAVAWSPIALAAGLVPEGAWVASLWTREFVGRLAGAVLAALAVGFGVALALTGSGDFVIFGVAGAFIAAGDLVTWLARTPGSGMGGLLGLGMRAGMGLVGGGGGGAAAAAAIPANQLSTVAEMYGYD
jgi:hypothetical protein